MIPNTKLNMSNSPRKIAALLLDFMTIHSFHHRSVNTRGWADRSGVSAVCGVFFHSFVEHIHYSFEIVEADGYTLILSVRSSSPAA